MLITFILCCSFPEIRLLKNTTKISTLSVSPGLKPSMEIYARLTMRQCYFVLTSFDNSSDCNLPLRLFKVSSMVKVTLTIFFFKTARVGL